MGLEAEWRAVGDPPCDSGCPLKKKCADQLLSCRQYWLYIEHPLSPRFSLWDGSTPGKGYYKRIYEAKDPKPGRKQYTFKRPNAFQKVSRGTSEIQIG